MRVGYHPRTIPNNCGIDIVEDKKQANLYAIITGASGGIGQALVHAFNHAGYSVIATDMTPPPDNLPCECFIKADLQQTVTDEAYAEELFAKIKKQLHGAPLKVLVNNAAIQIVSNIESLTRNNWQTTLNINLLAPFFWTQAFLSELEAAQGSVINISSIHARLTKREFAAYATSKASLSALTKSLALELGDRIKVNAIEPAAINTSMLKAGFKGNVDGLAQLEQYHPTLSIGSPEEIGELAIMIADSKLKFMNGAAIPLDGGISGRLYDPS